MTDRPAPPTDDPAAARERRRDLLFLGVFALVSVAIAVVDAFSVAHDRAEAGRPVALWEPLVWELTSVAVLTALAPFVMALTRRVEPLRAGWTRVLPVHACGALAYSFAHVAAMGALRWATYAALGVFYSALGPLGDFVYELRKDVVVYLAVVALYTAWLRLAPPSGTGVVAGDAAAEAIEVRDGARRHFVPLSEVAFIEAAGNYVELHRGRTPILHRAPLSSLERQLAGAGFVRIHRSRLVRRSAVSEVESKPSGDFVVRLSDGRELQGSRRYRKPLLDPA